MDLDDFEQVQDVDDAQAGDLQIQDWQEALRHFDESWYSAANRRGLIMDLIGDYGGSELFIIHGQCDLMRCKLLALITINRGFTVTKCSG